MKQHITVDQLNELTEEQKQRLRKWWKPEKYQLAAYYIYQLEVFDEFIVEGVTSDGLIEDYQDLEGILPGHHINLCLPILSIGQMMELLRDYKAYSATNNDLLWTIEPCDVLWYDVKLALEKGPAKCSDCGITLNSKNATKEPGFCDKCWELISAN